MIIEHSRKGFNEYILVESYQEFISHYDVAEQKFLDKFFLSKNYIPSKFPCAFIVKDYDKYSYRFDFSEYLKPCDITEAYHDIVDDWQEQINRQQNRVNEINNFFKKFCQTP